MADTSLDRLERRLRSTQGCTEYAAAIVRLRVENQELKQQVMRFRQAIQGFLDAVPQAMEIMEETREGKNV